MGGRRMLGKGNQGGGSCPSYTPGLYTAEEIDTLVNVDGYIPVASAAEFDLIDSESTQTMGAGTCWEDSYTTSVGAKYIQIVDITFSSTFAVVDLADGVYDGNNLSLIDVDNIIFNTLDVGGIIRNIVVDVVNNSTLNGTNTGGVLLGRNDGTISNCHINASVLISGTARGLMCGSNSGLIETSSVTGTISGAVSRSGLFIGNGSGTITNCTASGSITSTSNGEQIGGFFGQSTQSITISKCWADVVVTGGSWIGGFFGAAIVSGQTNTINECYALGNVNQNAGNIAGGFAAYVQLSSISITDCYAFGDVNGNSTIAAGFISFVRNVLTATNCYCVNTVINAGTNSGFNSAFTAGSTFSNCYFDETVKGDTVNDGGGTNQTTSALQTPTTNSGIYSAWTIPPWDFGTATDYPILTTTP